MLIPGRTAVKPWKLKHPMGHKICSNSQCVRIYRSHLLSIVYFWGSGLTWQCKLIQQCTRRDVSNISIYYMMSASYQSSLSKEIVKLYDLYLDNSIKKRKQIDCNACLSGEATVSEWKWVSFSRIKLSPIQTLVQNVMSKHRLLVWYSLFGDFLSVVQFVFPLGI
mgnify:CR=1 FL=1